MPWEPIDPIRAEMSKRVSLIDTDSNPAGIQQKNAIHRIGKKIASLFQPRRDISPLPQLTQLRSYGQPTIAFSARLHNGKVITEGSHVGQDIASQLNRLPKRFMQDPECVAQGNGLRILDEKLNVFHIQSTPAVAGVLKSSCTLAAQPWPPANPGRAHLGLVSGVYTTAKGEQFRLVEQRLHRFEPQAFSWLADKDQTLYSRLGLSKEGALMKVPLGISDISVEGDTQVRLEQSVHGASLEIARGNQAPGGRLQPVDAAGEPLELTHIGLAGDVLYAVNTRGELLRGDLPGAEDGRLTMVHQPVERLEQVYRGGVSFKGFMHDDNGQLNALLLDAHKQLHSSPLSDRANQASGWNLSDVICKVIDKGLPEPDLQALANVVDLGQRGKVVLQGDTLSCWNPGGQCWDKTTQANVEYLARGLDGRAYVLQSGELKALALHKSREPMHLGASHDLTPANVARTHVSLDEVMAGSAERAIRAFAVDNGRRFVSLDHENRLHAHVDGKDIHLEFAQPKDVQALALDHLGNLYAQSRTGELLRLDKAHWQTPGAGEVAWTPVTVPGNERVQSLRMGADRHLIASWGHNSAHDNRWGEKYRQLMSTPDGALQWAPVASQAVREGHLGTVLREGEIKGQKNATAWAVTSSVAGQKTEGLTTDRGYFKGLRAHFKPGEGIRHLGQDIQHRTKGRAGLQGLYADDKALRADLKGLANARPALQDMQSRVGQLSQRELALALESAIALVEKNSTTSARKLGDLHGAQVTPAEPDAAANSALGKAQSSLCQLRQAFESCAPSKTNATAALLRSYETQGLMLSGFNPAQLRDLKNPTALVESDLIHHAQTLSRLSTLITKLEGRHPDLARITASLEEVMEGYEGNEVHKKVVQNINSHAQAEDLYKNFKLLAKDLGTPGSALNMHITHLLGLPGQGGIKQALMQEIQQLESGQSIASSRSKTKGVGVAALGVAPVPVLEFSIGASRSKSNGVTISRTDTGASVDIKMNTTHALNAALGAGVTLAPVGGALGAGVRAGAEASLAVARETAASVSFEIKEADFSRMMELLTGEKGDVFDLLDLGSAHQSGKSSKNSVDLNLSAFIQGRAHFKAQENSQALNGLVRAVIGGSANLNLAHFDKSSARTQGEHEVTRTHGDNFQLLSKGSASIGAGAANAVVTAQVAPDGSTLAGSTGSEVALTVSFDRSASHAFRFTFKHSPLVEQSQVDELRDGIARFSAPLRAQLQALPSPGGEIGAQLQSLHQLLAKSPLPVTRTEEHFMLKDQLQTRIHQHELATQGKRGLSSVESTVSFVGLDGNAKHEWLDDTAPANKAAILQLLGNPQLAQTLNDLQSNKGTSVTIGLEVRPDVLRMLERTVEDGRDARHDVQQILENPHNLRVKSMSVSYTASRSHSMTLPVPVLSFGSSAALSHTHKLLNAEFEYGKADNVPVRMLFKDAVSGVDNSDLHPEQLEQTIRDGRRPEF